MTKILVVDNWENLRDDLTREASKEKGSEVIPAESAKQAIKIIQNQDIDLVITDLAMESDTAGLDVLKAAKEKNALTQVILVTAYGNKESKVGVQAMGMGAYDFIARNNTNTNYLSVLHTKISPALEFKNSKSKGEN